MLRSIRRYTQLNKIRRMFTKREKTVVAFFCSHCCHFLSRCRYLRRYGNEVVGVLHLEERITRCLFKSTQLKQLNNSEYLLKRFSSNLFTCLLIDLYARIPGNYPNFSGFIKSMKEKRWDIRHRCKCALSLKVSLSNE